MRPLRLISDQLRPQLAAKAGDYLILHLEEVGETPIKTIRPEMTAVLGVDQLHVDSHLALIALDRTLQYVADAKLLADLPCVNILALESEGGVARDHEGAAQAGKPGGEIFRDAVGEIILIRIAGEICERQHDDREMRQSLGRFG